MVKRYKADPEKLEAAAPSPLRLTCVWRADQRLVGHVLWRGDKTSDVQWPNGNVHQDVPNQWLILNG